MLLNFYNNFLGEAPKWYKNLIILFLASNPLIYIFLINIGSEAGFIMGWIILAQFILTLAMALNCRIVTLQRFSTLYTYMPLLRNVEKVLAWCVDGVAAM